MTSKCIENLEVCNFVLSCNDISTSDSSASYPVTNAIGTINNIRTDMTWFAINLRTVIGDYLYNKYEVFALKLTSVIHPTIASYGLFANDRCVTFYVSGFNWLNNTYDTLRGCNRTEVALGQAILQTTGTPLVTNFNNSNLATFSKTETVNVRIRYVNVLNINSRPNVTNTLFPRVTFYFSIIPIR